MGRVGTESPGPLLLLFFFLVPSVRLSVSLARNQPEAALRGQIRRRQTEQTVVGGVDVADPTAVQSFACV